MASLPSWIAAMQASGRLPQQSSPFSMGNYQFAPDRMSFIDSSQNPGAQWRDFQAGSWGDQQAGWYGQDGNMLEGTRTGYESLKNAGLWNPQDQQLQSLFSQLGGSDWQTNPMSTATLFGHLGTGTYGRDWNAGLDNEANYMSLWPGQGDTLNNVSNIYGGNMFSRDYLKQVEEARQNQQWQAEHADSTMGHIGEFAGDLAGLGLAGLGTYFGVAGLGGMFGGAGAAAGASEGAAWGAGLEGADLAAMEASAWGGASGGTSAAAGAGGLGAELAAGAPELAGTMGLPGEVAAGGAMDMFGSAAYPGGVAEAGMGAGSIFANAPMPNILESILGLPAGQLGLGGTQGLTQPMGGYQFPYSNVLGSLLGIYGTNKAGKQQEDLLQMAINSDQWRQQQPRYFEPLHQAATQGIGNTPYGQSIADSTSRYMASKGYNGSGNQSHAIAQGLHGGTMDYLRAVGPLAMGRGESSAPTQMAPGMIGNTYNQTNAMGVGLGSILQGQQPAAGQGQNKSLIDVFKSQMPSL